MARMAGELSAHEWEFQKDYVTAKPASIEDPNEEK